MSVRPTTTKISFARRLAVVGGLAVAGMGAMTSAAGALPGPVGPIPDLELTLCDPMPCTPPTTMKPPFVHPELDDLVFEPADPTPPTTVPPVEPPADEPPAEPPTTVAPQGNGGGTGGGSGKGGSKGGGSAHATTAVPATPVPTDVSVDPIMIDADAESVMDPATDETESALDAGVVRADRSVALPAILLGLALAGVLALVAGFALRRRRTA